ncbi:MAG TPA: patatin-like phospholipase family protein [Nitrososphaeraceae archaeon]|nr:patatin-like phospholipase family protein [Nitrososphaeraceae archaeon]
MPAIGVSNEKAHSFSFTAPYVKGDNTNTRLSFQLTTTTYSGKIATHIANLIVKKIHRAIIFQGGVALGAYEAGAFQALVENLRKEDESNVNPLKEKKHLFDIVAGTSIGAMNAAIVVNDIVEHKSWEDSAKDLVKFWNNQEYLLPTVADVLDMNPLYHYWWDIVHSISKASKQSASTLVETYSVLNPYLKNWYDFLMNYSLVDPNFWKDYLLDGWYIPSTAEAARRYYSAKQFHTFGVPDVASGIPPWSMFGKFFDLSEQSNLKPRPDNKHLIYYSLKKTLEKFVHHPIMTDKTQPRLLIVAVDVQTGDAVTFDSYEKNESAMNADGMILKDNNQTKYYSVYGADEQNNYIIFYGEGIDIEHILASGTFPNFFDYPKFKVKENINLDEEKRQHNFWDGGFRSNTPLREVIHAHRDYWHNKNKNRDNEDDVPDLEVYIANLWPSELKEKPISFDLDFVENRKLNIMFSDKTHYDEQVAEVVSDYIDLAKGLKSLAERSGASEKEINDILKKHAHSKNRKGHMRVYESLLGGRFRLTKVVRIDHKDDGNEVANKIYDYSHMTIENLMKVGYRDALNQIMIQSLKDGIMKVAYKKSIVKDKNGKYVKELEEGLQQIQKNMKIENGYDATINLVKEFIVRVESIENVVNGLSLKEEKASLIAAAKRFQEIVSE